MISFSLSWRVSKLKKGEKVSEEIFAAKIHLIENELHYNAIIYLEPFLTE
jgi:hypothetical protein